MVVTSGHLSYCILPLSLILCFLINKENALLTGCFFHTILHKL